MLGKGKEAPSGCFLPLPQHSYLDNLTVKIVLGRGGGSSPPTNTIFTVKKYVCFLSVWRRARREGPLHQTGNKTKYQ